MAQDPKPIRLPEGIVENLDGMYPDDLDAYAMRVDDVRGVVETLCAYARTKARAMRDRVAGRLQSALRHERRCEQLYQTLPPEARW